MGFLLVPASMNLNDLQLAY